MNDHLRDIRENLKSTALSRCSMTRICVGAVLSTLCVTLPACGIAAVEVLLAVPHVFFARGSETGSETMRALLVIQSLQSFVHQINQVHTVRRCSNSVVTIANIVRQPLILCSAIF